MDIQTATQLLRTFIGPDLTAREISPLYGGMVNEVIEILTDGLPASVVAKLSEDPDHSGFRWEYDALRHHRNLGSLPVPEPYACIDGDREFPFKAILMEKLPGRNLAQARLTRLGMKRLQEEMADRIAHLHTHRRETYGSALEEGRSRRWLEEFGPDIQSEFDRVADQLSPKSRSIVSRLMKHLEEWLPEFSQPTLVHGDLWSTNIMVEDSEPDSPHIAGFLDGGASFKEVEYELAYLRVFNAADASFFARYALRHPLREGFDRRCRVYWLNTMLLHLRHFGPSYLPACERLAGEIDRRW